MFACLTRTDSGDDTTVLANPYCAPKPLDFDYVPYGAHHVIHRLHHQVYHLRHSLLGSLTRIQSRREALGFSEDIFSKNLTGQQQ